MASWYVVWAVTILFLSGAAFCIGKGLYLHFSKRDDNLTEELEKRLGELTQHEKTVRHKIEDLENKRSQLGETCEISDIEWWLDDSIWRLRDIEWEKRDAKWEADDRSHQRRTSKATFWTVMGASLLASASLVVSIGGALTNSG